MRKLTLFVFFILLACSKDAPIPDAVVPTPIVTKFTLTVSASEGGSVDISGGTYNENSNVSVTAYMSFQDGLVMLREVQTHLLLV